MELRWNFLKNSLTCFLCPNGCSLAVIKNEGELIVSGNRCPKGIGFAEKELTDPERILTTTVKVKDSRTLLSVRSNYSVKKRELPVLVHLLNSLTVDPPIKIGQVLIEGLGENRVSIIATSGREY